MTRETTPARRRAKRLLTTVVATSGLAVWGIITPPSSYAVTCSTYKAASWGKGWACYDYDAQGRRTRVYGTLMDIPPNDQHCVSFAMRSANAIKDTTDGELDNYTTRHHNVACTNNVAVSFSYALSASWDNPGELSDRRAVATRENGNGTVLNYLTIDGGSCAGCG